MDALRVIEEATIKRVFVIPPQKTAGR